MEPVLKREDIDLEKIFATPQDETATDPVPGVDLEFPEVDFMEFKSDDTKLWTYRWAPSGDVKGVMIVFHGMNSYIGRTAHLGKRYAEAGFTCVGYDQPGHGKSSGTPGYLPSMKTVLADADRFCTEIEKMYPGQPLFISGQSFGGAICCRLGGTYPGRFKGMVLFNPAILEYKHQQKVGKSAIRFLSKIIPSWGIKSQVSLGIGCRNKKTTDDTWKDPLIYTGKIRPGSIATILQSMDGAHEHLAEISAPFLLIQAGNDKVIHPAGALDAMETAKSTDKQLMYYPQCWHDIWHEPEIFEILDRSSEWILKRA